MSDIADLLDEIQARAEAATEGPWKADSYWGEPYVGAGAALLHEIDYPLTGAGREQGCRDAEFIAAARTDVPPLVAALRGVLDVIGPHYATMMRREAKFGRTRSSCCCEQCRAVHAIADALGVEP